MGNHAASTHHMTFLLEFMFDHLSNSEKLEFWFVFSKISPLNFDKDKKIRYRHYLLSTR